MITMTPTAYDVSAPQCHACENKGRQTEANNSGYIMGVDIGGCGGDGGGGGGGDGGGGGGQGGCVMIGFCKVSQKTRGLSGIPCRPTDEGRDYCCQSMVCPR